MLTFLWILLPVLFLNSVSVGLYGTYGMYYYDFVQDFNSTYSFMGFVGTGVAFFMALFIIINPWMLNTFGYAICVVYGGLMMMLCFITTSYDTNEIELVFTYSLFLGMSAAISYLTYGHVIEHFSKRTLDLAMTAIQFSIGVFYMLFSCFVEYKLLHGGSWRHIFRYYFAPIGLVYALCAFFFLPSFPTHEYSSIPDQEPMDDSPTTSAPDSLIPPTTTPSHNVLSDSEPTTPADKQATIGGFQRLFSSQDNYSALKLTISNMLYLMCCFVPNKFALIFVSKNFSEGELVDYLVPISIGTSQAISCLLYAFISSCYPNLSSFHWTKIGQLGSMCASFLLAIVPSTYPYYYKLLAIDFFILFESIAETVLVQKMVEVLGTKFHVENLSVQLVFGGSAMTLGSVLTGLVYDYTSTFHPVFWLVTALYVISFIFDEIMFVSWIGWPLQWNLRAKREPI